MNSFNKRKILSYSIVIIMFDQISKFLIINTFISEGSINIIPNILNFTLVTNKGAAFSLFSNSITLLTFISISASFLLIIYVLNFPPRSYWNSIGLAFLLGGTVGNGIDRLLKGYVIDFIDIVPINFPIFNIADISINIAIVCFIIDVIRTRKKSKLKY
tara:strand:- start:1475 stop:1951 length:477 start_codon:yes stop_codon:yes gene_type:complete